MRDYWINNGGSDPFLVKMELEIFFLHMFIYLFLYDMTPLLFKFCTFWFFPMVYIHTNFCLEHLPVQIFFSIALLHRQTILKQVRTIDAHHACIDHCIFFVIHYFQYIKVVRKDTLQMWLRRYLFLSMLLLTLLLLLLLLSSETR